MTKIAWVCDKCNRLVVSDSKEHHRMDFCTCSECGYDLEEYMCRVQGNPRVIAELKEGGTWIEKTPIKFSLGKCIGCNTVRKKRKIIKQKEKLK